MSKAKELLENLAMTSEEFADALWNDGLFDYQMSDDYWSDNFSADHYLKILKAVAEEKGVMLTDFDDWDYEKYFWDLYQANDDKGLS